MFTKKYYAYRQNPVDVRFWSVTLEEIIKKKDEMSFADSPDDVINQIIDFRNRSISQIKEKLWRKEDDMWHDWFFFVPWENEMLIGYMMKQSNNWTTYVVSPVQPNNPSICGEIIEIEK